MTCANFAWVAFAGASALLAAAFALSAAMDVLGRWRRERRLQDEWSRQYARGLTAKKFEEWRIEK